MDLTPKEIDESIFGNQVMTANEEMYLTTYSNDSYSYLNNMLRGVNADEDRANEMYDDWQQAAADIDKAISRQTLKEDITVIRGVNIDAFGFDPKNPPSQSEWQRLVGCKIKDKGYASASATNTPFKRQALVNIKVPKGKGRGIYIANLSLHPYEGEYLIKRNSSYKIKSISFTSTGIAIINAEMEI